MLALCPSSGKFKECQSPVKLSKVLQNKRTLCAVSAKEGILLLSGKYDRPLILELGLPDGDFISYCPKTEDELGSARRAGWLI